MTTELMAADDWHAVAHPSPACAECLIRTRRQRQFSEEPRQRLLRVCGTSSRRMSPGWYITAASMASFRSCHQSCEVKAFVAIMGIAHERHRKRHRHAPGSPGALVPVRQQPPFQCRLWWATAQVQILQPGRAGPILRQNCAVSAISLRALPSSMSRHKMPKRNLFTVEQPVRSHRARSAHHGCRVAADTPQFSKPRPLSNVLASMMFFNRPG